MRGDEIYEGMRVDEIDEEMRCDVIDEGMRGDEINAVLDPGPTPWRRDLFKRYHIYRCDEVM